MNCVHAFAILQKAADMLFPRRDFPQDIIRHILERYFAVTEPLVAVSYATAVTLLRGNLFVRSVRSFMGKQTLFSAHMMPVSQLVNFGPIVHATRTIACANEFVLFLAHSRIYQCKFEFTDEQEIIVRDAEYIKMPGGDPVISMSCGNRHAAIITSGPDLDVSHHDYWYNAGISKSQDGGYVVNRLFTFGNNIHGQLGAGTYDHSDSPQLAWIGNVMSVICLERSTLLLADGMVFYAGLFSMGMLCARSFLKLELSGPIDTFRSMRLTHYLVVLSTETGTLYAITSTTPKMANLALFIPPTVEAVIGHVAHHERHIAYASTCGFILDDTIVCRWDALGGR